MASPVNRHCANCIGALSFHNGRRRAQPIDALRRRRGADRRGLNAAVVNKRKQKLRLTLRTKDVNLRRLVRLRFLVLVRLGVRISVVVAVVTVVLIRTPASITIFCFLCLLLLILHKSSLFCRLSRGVSAFPAKRRRLYSAAWRPQLSIDICFMRLRSAANPPAAVAVVNRWDRQTE